ncbi:MAG: hypothetical protein ABJK39_03525 [Hyphomicrobiales bacterium]
MRQNFLTLCEAVSGVTEASKVAGSFLITLSKHPIEFDPRRLGAYSNHFAMTV